MGKDKDVEQRYSGLPEQHDAKLEALRAALIKGEASGIDEDYSIEDVQRELDWGQ